ncbi:MAG: hypothetical protein K2Q97_16530 [Burkholderiaceae bacterium]|nr:hypothetical protein [Burkholderiaceae bacterium]
MITPPEVCAREILNGVAKRKRKIVTGHKSRLVDFISRLLPTQYHWVIKRDVGI